MTNKVAKLMGLFVLVALLAMTANAWAGDDGSARIPDGVKVASLVHEFEAMNSYTLEDLAPLPTERFELPDSSVHVMRATVEETYVIDGVGEDTVELRGWIAVRHGNPRPAYEGAEEVNWNNAVLDTEFVGMHLTGVSDLFGPVEVKLNPNGRSEGQVGHIDIDDRVRKALPRLLAYAELPDTALVAGIPAGILLASAGDKDYRGPKFDNLDGTRQIESMEKLRPVPQLSPDAQREIEKSLTPADGQSFLLCQAPTDPMITIADLGLEMETSIPTFWYSIVDTVPPVGQTASVTAEPVDLVVDGRRVGVLKSGTVKFREIVKRVHLEEEPIYVPGDYRYAQNEAEADTAVSGR